MFQPLDLEEEDLLLESPRLKIADPEDEDLSARQNTMDEDKEESVGNRVRAKVVKNKLSPPFRTAEFEILFDEGISEEGDVLDMAIAEKLIQKSGSWFSLDGENLGQGRENTRIFLKDHPEIVEKLTNEILRTKQLKWFESSEAATTEEKAEVPD